MTIFETSSSVRSLRVIPLPKSIQTPSGKNLDAAMAASGRFCFLWAALVSDVKKGSIQVHPGRFDRSPGRSLAVFRRTRPPSRHLPTASGARSLQNRTNPNRLRTDAIGKKQATVRIAIMGRAPITTPRSVAALGGLGDGNHDAGDDQAFQDRIHGGLRNSAGAAGKGGSQFREAWEPSAARLRSCSRR